jgi:hypothetical protein
MSPQGLVDSVFSEKPGPSGSGFFAFKNRDLGAAFVDVGWVLLPPIDIFIQLSKNAVGNRATHLFVVRVSATVGLGLEFMMSSSACVCSGRAISMVKRVASG